LMMSLIWKRASEKVVKAKWFSSSFYVWCPTLSCLIVYQ